MATEIDALKKLNRLVADLIRLRAAGQTLQKDNKETSRGQAESETDEPTQTAEPSR